MCVSLPTSDLGFPSRRRVLGAAGLAALVAGSAGFAAATSRVAATDSDPWNADDSLAPRVRRAMTFAANAFLGALTPEQRAKAQYANLGDQARTQWSNFPAGASPRAGIAIGDLTDAQRILVHDLLRASTSSQGYHKMTGAIRADDVLHDVQGDALFGSAKYYASVFGSPDQPNWAWMLTGHHMSAIFTIARDRIGFAPMFAGAQPLQISSGTNAGWQVLPHEAGYAGELLASLTAEQKRAAVIGESAPFDLLAGPGRQESLKTFAGIDSQRLDSGQQRVLWLLVQEFAGNANAEAVAAQLALVREGWKQTHFAWQGPPPDAASRYYFRVHGPRILIEYDVQEPLASGGGHVHAIMRDPQNDYGVDWLGLHYKEVSHGPGGPSGPGGPGRGGPFQRPPIPHR